MKYTIRFFLADENVSNDDAFIAQSISKDIPNVGDLIYLCEETYLVGKHETIQAGTIHSVKKIVKNFKPNGLKSAEVFIVTTEE